jgi:ABC transporter substrate binding protein (PQQ-dependent alcohol dehydrogenase system)
MTEARRAGLVAAWLLAALALPAAPLSAPGMAQEEARALAIGYLQIADDPRYEPRRGYTGLSLKDLERPVDGARRAIHGSRALARALQIDFALEEAEAETGEELVAVMTRMLRERDVRLFLLDAPAEVLKAAAAALGAEPALLFNITETADSLRGADCGARLMHVMPSRAMLSDALAQYLVAKDWKRVLLLKGPLPEDEVLAGAFVRSAGKFGVRIVASRDFVPGQDPRERDRNNIVLLTTAPEHDVIFLADSEGEFAHYVPYQSRQPRPVVGSEGLTASAWHWTWERHGAPQLNQRFEKLAGRRMQDIDWAAWAAVKAIVEAAARTDSTEVAALAAYLHGPELSLDAYKGTPASFRAWNNQLRQPILLHSHNAVADRAPLPGFLHPSENMDTLGLDAPESACRF